ncbi:MAG: Rieske 2Fe-2S domain-containing protein [Rhodospirillaceae bacterium]|nr:Rieske 2Fe-2S domain-containing protein [Rhodospirillaceae bacterium]
MSIRYDRPWHTRPFAPSQGDTVCDADAIVEGEAREFVYGEGKTAFELIVVGTADGPRAYLNQCPHFKIKMNVRSDEILNTHGLIQCAWHYACFRPEDGHCVSGPVEGDVLHSVPIAICNGSIMIGEPEVSGLST